MSGRKRVVVASGTRGADSAGRPWSVLLYVLAAMILLTASLARAQLVETVTVQGAKRTSQDTIVGLLPRRPPTNIDAAELEDFARRLHNLAVFDYVEVQRIGTTLRVTLREKWTLIPDLSFSTGRTSHDLSFELGAVEYHLLGLGLQLGATLYRRQRALGFVCWLGEHPYRLFRWSRGGAVEYANARYRFDDGRSYRLAGPRISAWLSSPPFVSRYLRYRIDLRYQIERVHDEVGEDAPPSGHAVVLGSGLSYDRYRWHDYVPRGFKMSVSFGPGFFAPSDQPRHFIELEVKAALPLTSRTVVAGRLKGGLITRGNANASYLVGSMDGVRGLEDALYRNWAQAVANLELRQAVQLFERVAVQFVVFADAAPFARMSGSGGRGERIFAASFGGGLRVLPTFLAQVALRFDLARLIAPSHVWVPLLGVTQYF